MKEQEIEETIRKKLASHDIYPESIFFTYLIDNGALAITFYIPQEIDEILKLLDYSKLCDKSGWMILKNTNTIIASGMALLKIYSTL